MNHRPLLVEIGCEELPAAVVGPAADYLLEQLALAVGATASSGRALGTPRRLIAHLPEVLVRQPDRREQAMGPALSVARGPDGAWTKAALGFARGQGVAIADLQVIDTPKGSYVAVDKFIAGQPIADIVAAALPKILRTMPLPKRMRWGQQREPFIRPLHWLVALHGDTALPFEFAGVASGNQVGGHRFYGPQQVQACADLDQHLQRLRDAHVVADPAERRQIILRGLRILPAELGATWRQDLPTLETVVQLVEWPAPLLGTFDPQFLQIPPEVIFTTLRENQKLFTLNDATGKLSNHFIAVANTLSEASRATVAAGNARVVSARLSDAQFFYKEDTKLPLAQRVAALDDRIYLAGLGSIGQRGRRIAMLAALIAGDGDAVLLATVARAALLCKADLTTKMVFEFTELQGVIGAYYALADGETAQVAQAIAEHYQPKFAGDELPVSRAGQIVALADKLDAIAGCFALGLQPTGAQDPYSLRRAAVGVLRIMAQTATDLGLRALVVAATAALPEPVVAKAGPTLVDQIVAFLRGRLASMHAADHPPDAIEAVLEAGFDAPSSVAARLSALHALRGEADFAALAAAFKRVANLVKKSADAGDLGATFAAQLCDKDVELALANQAAALQQQSAAAVARGDFAGALRLLAQLRPHVDAFFDGVMVLADDPAVRRNRLALLHLCSELFAPIADFGKLQG